MGVVVLAVAAAGGGEAAASLVDVTVIEEALTQGYDPGVSMVHRNALVRLFSSGLHVPILHFLCLITTNLWRRAFRQLCIFLRPRHVGNNLDPVGRR